MNNFQILHSLFLAILKKTRTPLHCLPRAADWTWGIGLNHDLTLGNWGYMLAHLNYAFRDESAFTDNNLGIIQQQEVLDAGLDFHSNDDYWVFSLYGKNLLDDVKHGGDAPLPEKIGPSSLGGTFSPLAKGRYYGAEITYTFY